MGNDIIKKEGVPMIRLNCDYLEGCHPSILEKLTATNLEQTPGYGTDHYCEEAKGLIRAAFGCPDAYVHFMVGGTQANMTVIAAALRPWEGILCAETGHINTHETGAVESTGHKCLALPHVDGKITAHQVSEAMRIQDDFEHTVRPGMVYISMSTEVGTVYTKDELAALHAVCKEQGLLLFIDGARLGYALAAFDGTPADLAANCDVFTVGGTKMGALFGEAIVINCDALNTRFRYSIKQRGGMLAKGRLLGLQFIGLMENGLYFQLGEKAVAQAMRIRAALLEKGIPLHVDSPTNQLFCILTKAQAAKLAENFVLEFNEETPRGDVWRICTSWCTPEEYVAAIVATIGAL